MSTPDPSVDAPTAVSDLSYEQARDELVRLVSRIESGQVPLEEAMLLWERGEELAAHCQARLDAAQDSLDRATGQGRPVGTGAGAAGDAPGEAGAVEEDGAPADGVPAGKAPEGETPGADGGGER